MTTGEKMVWAAVFAKHYDTSDPPRSTMNDDEKWGEWRDRQMAKAVERAGIAVEHLLHSVPVIEDSATLAHFNEMTNGEEQ